MIKSQFISQQNSADTFRFLASGQTMELFQGNFLVPGIKEVSLLQGSREIRVRDSWGFNNREWITSYQEPTSLVFYILPNPLLRILLRSIAEEWQIEETSFGARVQRSFSLAPRLFAGPLLPILEKILAKAIKKNNETLSFHLLLKDKERVKPLL